MKPKTSEDEPCDCDYATTEDESETSEEYWHGSKNSHRLSSSFIWREELSQKYGREKLIEYLQRQNDTGMRIWDINLFCNMTYWSSFFEIAFKEIKKWKVPYMNYFEAFSYKTWSLSHYESKNDIRTPWHYSKFFERVERGGKIHYISFDFLNVYIVSVFFNT